MGGAFSCPARAVRSSQNRDGFPFDSLAESGLEVLANDQVHLLTAS